MYNIDKILNEWFNYREESISILDSTDKKYAIQFDKHFNNIIEKTSENNKASVKKSLYELDNEYSNYTYYWNKKYYFYGFKDAIKLFLYGIN